MLIATNKQGHEPRHGIGREHVEKMGKSRGAHGWYFPRDFGGLLKRFGSITTWPPDMAAYEGAHGELKESEVLEEPFDITTPQGGEAATVAKAQQGGVR